MRKNQATAQDGREYWQRVIFSLAQAAVAYDAMAKTEDHEENVKHFTAYHAGLATALKFALTPPHGWEGVRRALEEAISPALSIVEESQRFQLGESKYDPFGDDKRKLSSQKALLQFPSIVERARRRAVELQKAAGGSEIDIPCLDDAVVFLRTTVSALTA